MIHRDYSRSRISWQKHFLENKVSGVHFAIPSTDYYTDLPAKRNEHYLADCWYRLRLFLVNPRLILGVFRCAETDPCNWDLKQPCWKNKITCDSRRHVFLWPNTLTTFIQGHSTYVSIPCPVAGQGFETRHLESFFMMPDTKNRDLFLEWSLSRGLVPFTNVESGVQLGSIRSLRTFNISLDIVPCIPPALK